MAFHRNPSPANRPSGSARPSTDGDDAVDRTHVVYARHQWFGFTLLGAACCFSAFIFSQWQPTATEATWFWIVVGPLVGVVAMFRSQAEFGGEGADSDAGPYIGALVATTLIGILLGVLGIVGWILPGLFVIAAGIVGFMAWRELSGIGMTTALTVAVLAAAIASASVTGWAVALSFLLGLMLLTSALALTVGAPPPAVSRRS